MVANPLIFQSISAAAKGIWEVKFARAIGLPMKSNDYQWFFCSYECFFFCSWSVFVFLPKEYRRYSLFIGGVFKWTLMNFLVSWFSIGFICISLYFHCFPLVFIVFHCIFNHSQCICIVFYWFSLIFIAFSLVSLHLHSFAFVFIDFQWFS